MIVGNTSSLTYHLDDMDIREALRKFRELDFENLEIGHYHPINVLEEFSGEFNFVSYHHFTESRLDTEIDQLREELEEPLEICRELGIEHLTFHPWYEDDFKKAVKNLEKLQDEIEPEIAIENFPPETDNCLLTSPEDFEKIKDAGFEPGILLDLGHCYGENLEGFLNLKEHIEVVHLQDSIRGEIDEDHLPIGAGEIDFSSLEPLKDRPWVLELKHADTMLLHVSRAKAEEIKGKL